jgi:hypothetical protein
MKGISDDLRRFVRTHFRSMLQLEALLLLAADAHRSWSAEALNRELRSSLATTLRHLEHLVDRGLAEKAGDPDTRFRYRTQTEDVHRVVDELATLHRTRFHALMELLYASNRAQDFADAFKIGKNEKDDDG